jgi:hypothetical protein
MRSQLISGTQYQLSLHLWVPPWYNHKSEKILGPLAGEKIEQIVNGSNCDIDL